MYRVGRPIHAHSSITACADTVCGRTLPRHAFFERPTSPLRARRSGQPRINGLVRQWCHRVIVEVMQSAGAGVGTR
jgi:hypothetical protein